MIKLSRNLLEKYVISLLFLIQSTVFVVVVLFSLILSSLKLSNDAVKSQKFRKYLLKISKLTTGEVTRDGENLY